MGKDNTEKSTVSYYTITDFPRNLRIVYIVEDSMGS